jgi:hypothetical protein
MSVEPVRFENGKKMQIAGLDRRFTFAETREIPDLLRAEFRCRTPRSWNR